MGCVVLACRVLTGVVFLVAVAGKLRDFPGFAKSVRGLAFVPSRLVMPAAWGTIAAESGTVVLVAVPPTAGWGLALALALDLVFTASIVAVLARGVSVSCHCFGTTPRRFGMRHVVRDVFLAAVSLAGLVGVLADGARPPSVAGPAAVLGVGLGLLGAVVTVVFDSVAELFITSSAPKAF